LPPDAPLRMAGGDLVEVDALLQGLGEIGAELAAMRQAMAALEAGARNAARLPAGQLARQMVASERALAAGMDRIERELRQARDAAERLRLAPVGSVTGVLERCARDAAVSQGKQVHFEAHAGKLRVDGFVLDQVQGALVQLVRNAVAHGIESAQERRAAGKPALGRIVLEASRQGGRARFRCSDDGRGIDLEAVRGALARAGAPAAELAQDDAGRLLARLFRGGVSTRTEVSELAGRGIGLDVVRAALDKLNGTVQARTGPSGTVVDLEVPLTLASLDVLQVEAGGRRLALPLDAVRATLRITPDVVLPGPDGNAVRHAGQVMPLVPLQLDGVAGGGAAPRSAVVLAGDTPAALGVTRLAGIDTVVLQPPPALAAALDYVMGIYFSDDGAPGLVLDPAPLVAGLLRARGGGVAPARPLPVLVVDDSLTTRMLECSILESAGFEVALAASAEEGLEMAARNAYGLVLCDVEMPGMDGFGFLARMQADPALRHIPCMLVTSRNAPEDLQRGRQAGARGHIVKSEFDQADFLGRVRELVLS
jgi:two-component system chemotaxis sensor kinase CheA